MYGLVNQAIEGLVREKFGDAAWEDIRQDAGGIPGIFVSMDPYDDDVTRRLVGAASRQLGLSEAAILEAFGEYWTRYTGQKGYGELFALSGPTFREFMLNLPHLHTRVAAIYPDLKPPVFWCTHVTDSSLRLHYQSTRPGLTPMVLGLIKGLGDRYRVEVGVSLVRSRGDGADHDEFDVTFRAPEPS